MRIGRILIDGPMGVCHFSRFGYVVSRRSGYLIQGMARDALVGNNFFCLYLFFRSRCVRLSCVLSLARAVTLISIRRRASSHNAARKHASYKNNG